MLKIPLVTSSTEIALDEFWKSVLLYYNRPHIINRKISGVVECVFCEIFFKCNGIEKINELFTFSALIYEIRKFKILEKQVITKRFLYDLLSCYDKNVDIKEASLEDLEGRDNGLFVSVRILIPRGKKCEKSVEVVTLDKELNMVTFFAVSEKDSINLAPPFPYTIELTKTGSLKINLDSFEDADTASAEWLADKLFPKLIKWTEGTKGDQITSLGLICLDEYSLMYNKLKNRYAEPLLQEWTNKAKTDPQKYIFEDLAIASYLICLWNNLLMKNINFVDCGCGNGLLVHVLNQEGFKGCGIDIRRREIWDIYPESTCLKVGTVMPESTFPDCNWIIGNHSDELTPWIPIIALKSSPQTNYFVLPCCPHDLNGRKYIRNNTNISQYADYLNYIKDISQMSGFSTEVDKLRIPSTKRTCLVGIRTHVKESDVIDRFIQEKLKSVKNFVPRPSVERVRNCTKLDKNLINRLITKTVELLLSSENLLHKVDGTYWNKGQRLSLRELSERLSKEDLKQLKQECGGLQTLLKNHRYLFEIKEGNVELREPVKKAETNKYLQKPCWFHMFHPNGCLYDANICGYLHKD